MEIASVSAHRPGSDVKREANELLLKVCIRTCPPDWRAPQFESLGKIQRAKIFCNTTKLITYLPEIWGNQRRHYSAGPPLARRERLFKIGKADQSSGSHCLFNPPIQREGLSNFASELGAELIYSRTAPSIDHTLIT